MVLLVICCLSYGQVRERLSRECADTLLQIASAKSALKQLKARHEVRTVRYVDQLLLRCTSEE